MSLPETQHMIDARSQAQKPYLVYGPDVKDFFDLLKPRVMSLVVFTAFIGLMLAPGALHPMLSFIAILCIAVGAGASGALNMWYDADIDAIMSRTANRPIPAGRVSSDQALTFALILSAASVMVLGLATNWLAAGLLAFTIFFYAVIYTMWLKRLTPQNIVIGGAAGAFPPMIGWAAVTGTIPLESVVLFSIIFFWTPPHFWALALCKSADYEAAKVPMMPNVAGAVSTKKQIFIYAVILWLVTLTPALIGMSGWLYAAFAILMGAVFVGYCWRLIRANNDQEQRVFALGLFVYSIIYLFVLYLVILTDNLFVVPFAPLIWGA